MPPAMTASETASAAKAGDVLATVSFSQKWAMPIETSGSAVVMMAGTGEMRMPAWMVEQETDRPDGSRETHRRAAAAGMDHPQEPGDPAGAEDEPRDHDRIGLAVPGQHGDKHGEQQIERTYALTCSWYGARSSASSAGL